MEPWLEYQNYQDTLTSKKKARLPEMCEELNHLKEQFEDIKNEISNLEYEIEEIKSL